MLKKFVAGVILSLLLATLVSYAFAQCNPDRQMKDQKVTACQCCCCNCAKSCNCAK